MTELLLGVAKEALALINTEESRKYQVKLLKLSEEWNAEINKPRAQRNNANLDDIDFRLRDIARFIIDRPGK